MATRKAAAKIVAPVIDVASIVASLVLTLKASSLASDTAKEKSLRDDVLASCKPLAGQGAKVARGMIETLKTEWVPDLPNDAEARKSKKSENDKKFRVLSAALMEAVLGDELVPVVANIADWVKEKKAATDLTDAVKKMVPTTDALRESVLGSLITAKDDETVGTVWDNVLKAKNEKLDNEAKAEKQLEKAVDLQGQAMEAFDLLEDEFMALAIEQVAKLGTVSALKARAEALRKQAAEKKAA